MKKIVTSVFLCVCVAASVGAQTVYDAARITNKDLNGTARFVGMGGAMGALGGDISTIGTNPAGIGIYRSNDVMVSFGYSTMGTDSKYGTNKISMNKDYWTFDNVGFVFSTKIGNHTPLRYVNFGFNYQRAKNFDRNMSMAGRLNTGPNGAIISQTNQMAAQANGLSNSYLSDPNNNLFRDNEVGWLTALGWNGWLIDETDTDGEYLGYTRGEIPYANFTSRETGGIDQYDFNVSLNLNDRVYLGVTIGAYDVDYNKYTFYDEGFDEGEGYGLHSYNKISGAGFDFKLGAIFRPFETSPLRIGVAVHTPTFYNLTQYNSVELHSEVYVPDKDKIDYIIVDSYDYLNNRDNAREFRLHTPWKYNFSLGYVVGNNLALGAEYEFQDYSTIKFRDPDYGSSWFEYENSTTSMLKGVSTLRLGAEYKVIPEFAIRAGYNYSSAIFKSDAYKALPINSVNTDTDFSNSKSINNFTVGIGYRGSSIYADLAYQYTGYKEDFYAFDELYLNKTDVKNSKSQVLLTLGMRF